MGGLVAFTVPGFFCASDLFLRLPSRLSPVDNNALDPQDLPQPDHYFTANPASSDELRPMDVTLAGRELQLVSAPGIFSPGHIDTGTRVLLRKVPPAPPTGDLVDLGSGWGPIALTMALQSPQATVWAVDVNRRALDLVERNAKRAGVNNIHVCTPEEVPPHLSFSAMWSNPPVRIGKQALHDMLDTWLPRLRKDAAALLVIQRHLGADSLHNWLSKNWQVERRGSAKGFRVLSVQHKDEPSKPSES